MSKFISSLHVPNLSLDSKELMTELSLCSCEQPNWHSFFQADKDHADWASFEHCITIYFVVLLYEIARVSPVSCNPVHSAGFESR